MRLVRAALFLPALGGICQAMPTEHSHSHSNSHSHAHAWYLHLHDAHNASLQHTDQNNADTGVLARNVKRAQKDNQCGGRYGNMLVEAWEDARDAVDSPLRFPNIYLYMHALTCLWWLLQFDEMIERSQSLADWLSTEPDDIPGEDEPELYSALLTFEAYFGKLDRDEDGATVVEGKRGVFVCILLVIQEWLTERRRLDVAMKLRTALDASTSTTRPIIDLRCDSTWLEHIEGTSYRDTRPADRGGDLIRDMGDLGVCRPADAKEQLVAFWCGDKLDPHNRAEVITFCPEPNKQYTDFRLSAYKDTTYESRASHLDDFKDLDVPFEGGPNGAAYGWGPVTTLAEQSSEMMKRRIIL
ncbi:hypothetical protein BJX68DRAFT_273511 [Aspergillus pseudodeflectus]|uniref:Uncharacterized protein n=1 Tax=Aspergillus pseudodeflectus TaxID=176178 RepID=A0ABR4J8S1_9EURO